MADDLRQATDIRAGRDDVDTWAWSRRGRSAMPLSASRIAKLSAQFDDEPAYKTVGLQLSDLRRGRCLTRTLIDPALLHHRGTVQGGIIAMILDATAGYTALTEIECEDTSDDMATLEFKTSFLAAAQGEHMECLAETVRSGRQIVFCRARLWAIAADREPTLCAEATLTFIRLTPSRG